MSELINYKSPVYQVQAVPVEKVRANSYNPNVVAPPEIDVYKRQVSACSHTPIVRPTYILALFF